ncbi:hypothetical protein LCGC14_1964710 [marine sediment metagenome]|uniref:Uncharacterized protein n=1 Tax=marine sediment metagenome TaxID=412755 RepID=A0A0F9G1W1_9ZZZZ
MAKNYRFGLGALYEALQRALERSDSAAETKEHIQLALVEGIFAIAERLEAIIEEMTMRGVKR